MGPQEKETQNKTKKSFQQPNPKGGRDKGTDKKGKGKREPPKTIIVWILIVATVFLGLRFMQTYAPYRPTKISYSQFKKIVANYPEKIASVTVISQGVGRATLNGELTEDGPLAALPGVRHAGGSRYFIVNLPFVDGEMLKEWDAVGFPYTFEVKEWSVWDILLSWAPMLLFIFLWLFVMRQMQAGQKGIFAFGKSRAKMAPIDRPQNSFDDVAGVEEAKTELQEIIEFLKDPQKFKRLGGKIPKGVLLLGSPGTGKTLLARCVAGEAGVPFLSMSGSDFVEMFVGVGASRVRDLFDTAKKHSPCIIFIDEIDAVGRQRGAGLGGGHDEREQTLNAMLVEMDGFEVNSGVILIAATNRPDVLDPALLRPGRFDRQVVVDIPDIKGREGILRVHTKKIPLDDNVNLEVIARATPGFVGADLANMVNEAALLGARFGEDKVTMQDFEEARDKVMMGVERKSRVLTEKEKKTTAYHEAGHAICHIYCPESDPLHKVTIIPRGRALGLTWSLPKDDSYTKNREQLIDEICALMGGRAAEEIVFSQQTSGAAGDILQATKMVRKMVCDFGMTEQLGPLAYGEKNEQIFLGREFNQHRDYSEQTAQQIDILMREIIEEQYARARKILTGHKDELELLADALMEHELLDADEVARVIKGETLLSVKKTRPAPPRSIPQKPAEKDEKETRDVPVEPGRDDSREPETSDKTGAGAGTRA